MRKRKKKRVRTEKNQPKSEFLFFPFSICFTCYNTRGTRVVLLPRHRAHTSLLYRSYSAVTRQKLLSSLVRTHLVSVQNRCVTRKRELNLGFGVVWGRLYRRLRWSNSKLEERMSLRSDLRTQPYCLILSNTLHKLTVTQLTRVVPG